MPRPDSELEKNFYPKETYHLNGFREKHPFLPQWEMRSIKKILQNKLNRTKDVLAARETTVYVLNAAPT